VLGKMTVPAGQKFMPTLLNFSQGALTFLAANICVRFAVRNIQAVRCTGVPHSGDEVGKTSPLEEKQLDPAAIDDVTLIGYR
jgi:hypothetical protein